jgi:site-specific DNA-methyltransferase (adenine-specific)
MEIINKKIDELIPYEKNPRKNDEAVDYVANSIKEFGFKVPIVIDKNNVIVAGHTRLKASKKLGLKEVPCIVADDLTEEQIKAFRLADNKVSELAEWDFSILTEELENLDIDMEQFGFEDLEIEEEKEIVEDEVPEVPEEPKAKLGDIYQLGNHRLMCGDSTSEEDIAKLMNGVKADMVFTDPPYGMNLDTNYKMGKEEVRKDLNVKESKGYKKVIGDSIDFKDELITTIFNNFDYCKEIFIWGGDYFPELLKDYKKGNYIVWDKIRNENMEEKGQFEGFGLSSFELCWSKQKHKKDIVRILWRGLFGTEKEFDHQRIHPTQKPIKLSSWFIDKYSKENDLIVDIYGGSGSTLIACEQLNRKCYMMELDPHYIDVIIQRWENFTGEKAVKLND